MEKKRNRRKGYWKVYDQAAAVELCHLFQTITMLVEEEGSPWLEPKTRRGRSRVHSHLKLAVLAIGHNVEVLNRLEWARRLGIALDPILPRIQE